MEKTLAAEVFEQHEYLIAIAESSATFGELAGRLSPILVDRAGEAPDVADMSVGLDGAGAFVVVEGDLLLDADEFRLYALRRECLRTAGIDDPVPSVPLEPSGSLTGIRVGAVPARWPEPTALAYCVFETSFPDGNSYSMVVENIAAAADAWQRACGVRFLHRQEFDTHDDPTTTPSSIDPSLVFSVRYLDAGGQFIASAFFPTQPPARRRVFIDPSYFAPDMDFDRVGVLRHELGHVLGFRHEQIRSGAPSDCPNEEGGQFVDLTQYDPQSVMHYFCGGVGSKGAPDFAA